MCTEQKLLHFIPHDSERVEGCSDSFGRLICVDFFKFNDTTVVAVDSKGQDVICMAATHLIDDFN